MMKKIAVLAIAMFLLGCAADPEPQQEVVTNTKDQSKKVSETVASHTIERTPKPENVGVNSNTNKTVEMPKRSETRRKFSRSGDPIDTKKFDSAIADAKKASDAKPDDAELKKTLGSKYFERGVALTAARQYASAIGDFRKAIKLDPSNKDAESNIKMIESIYKSMNIEGPKPGEEPEPIRKQ